MTASIVSTIPQWTLGDRLRKAREHAGMEQGELAVRIGISRGTVSNYELGRGTRPPKVVVLRAWAYECGVPYEWLTAGAPAVHGGADMSDTWQEASRNTGDYSPLLAA